MDALFGDGLGWDALLSIFWCPQVCVWVCCSTNALKCFLIQRFGRKSYINLCVCVFFSSKDFHHFFTRTFIFSGTGRKNGRPYNMSLHS